MRINPVIATRVGSALALAFCSLLVGVHPAAAVDQSKGTPGMCPSAVGVTVVVDFQHLGGETIVRCFPSASPGTGLDALKGAGFQIEGVQRWGEAFVCRIENRPSAVEAVPIAGNPGYKERCVDTPPASGYWSYWSAGNDCAWQLSQWGVKNRNFVPGGFEGWSFSLNATASTIPTPRVAPTRPGTGGGACTTAGEPAPPPNDPGATIPPGTTPKTIATPPLAATPTGAGASSASANATPSGASTNGNAAAGSGPADATANGKPSSTKSATPTSSVGTASVGKAAAVSGSAQASSAPRAASSPDIGGTTDSTYTGGENAADVKALVRDQSGASPIAKWVAAGLVAALIAGALVTARRRRAARNA